MSLLLHPNLGALAAVAPREEGRCPPAVRVPDTGDGCYRAEVTDGRRLIVVRSPCADTSEGPAPELPLAGAGELLVPAADWKAGFKLAGAGKKQRPVALAGDGEEFLFADGGKTVTGKVHEGRFPPVEMALPKRPALVTVRLNPELLIGLLQVVSALGPSGVELLFYGRSNPLGLACKNEQGQHMDALLSPLT